MTAIDHVRRALECLSLRGETLRADDLRPLGKFTMCMSEDIDRINSALPSPMFVAISQAVREAWEELKMAEAALQPPPGKAVE